MRIIFCNLARGSTHLYELTPDQFAEDARATPDDLHPFAMAAQLINSEDENEIRTLSARAILESRIFQEGGDESPMEYVVTAIQNHDAPSDLVITAHLDSGKAPSEDLILNRIQDTLAFMDKVRGVNPVSATIQ